MVKYNPAKIEKKWQKKWYNSTLFKAKNGSKAKKFYLLVEFPYPSGDGLHVGHCRSYTALDIIARKRRMQGQNVLFPMGWDAFGLPTENYAIKKGVHPSVVTKKNTENFKKQMKNLGLSFDWSREINTTDPAYYAWTQWIFIKLFEKGLAYKDNININWCPSCKIGLANEEVVDGKCERCGTKVEKREKKQWLIKITKYADRLIKDLDLVDYPERVKDQQKNWIGKSEGAEIDFLLNFKKDPKLNENRGSRGERAAIKVFTTRPDTIFGATYLVLSPEHLWVQLATDDNHNVLENKEEVKAYVQSVKHKPEIERIAEGKEKSGVEIKGVVAINPATGKEIPLFVADYVLAQYGTGAIMAVPADDKRDKEFAETYRLPIIENYQKAGFEDFGKKTVNYKLRDWVFSRQHYWGEPIPMIFCGQCGWQPVPEKDLPVELPKVKKYQPTDTGESPLSAMTVWVKAKCPTCKGPAVRETDTMPNWAGSNWYYLAYVMRGVSNLQFPMAKYREALKYWMPVDWYNGGMEHTTLHLLYSRFIFKFLWDIGAVPQSIGSEPYKKRTSHGVILGPGGVKMSKSKGNVINPDDVVKQYGADTLRLYEMFMGPFDQMIPWDPKGIIGARRFIEKVYVIAHKKTFAKKGNAHVNTLLNKTIKKVSEDIEAMKFNTAISSLMVLVNSFSENLEQVTKEHIKNLLLLISPFAPHITEELWQNLKYKGLCSAQKWPVFDKAVAKEERVVLIVQINGKVRDKQVMNAGSSQQDVEKIVLQSEKIKAWIAGKEIKKVIFVPGKLINIVI
ncbi:MAG: leucine--tRNA ligase [Candidatus Staskawiczbacteria bacterium RIFCSPLOWO2_01_FULL_40_39]|uniref:Leucine--tRNA ligase n=1 Tax=Candidatus Staskawiczbacteria bacterium RIFCSPHIGHO2_01_FULL_39_25 TaxID=1802202 RepID=A0A1G2HQD9_9BACT|nr:MAG: leucine--tRNA ligase [Candidatus Staskawiczbacteria bacterium RIFCSPHIGHO2_01_FULL_39_25]OGZ73914.1 MAG: leucine--tRNA ligase [Candidatus Staskawiczbacteria bacterium RIFCSPLOWO2_01_FULL_40_39]